MECGTVQPACDLSGKTAISTHAAGVYCLLPLVQVWRALCDLEVSDALHQRRVSSQRSQQTHGGVRCHQSQWFGRHDLCSYTPLAQKVFSAASPQLSAKLVAHLPFFARACCPRKYLHVIFARLKVPSSSSSFALLG